MQTSTPDSPFSVQAVLLAKVFQILVYTGLIFESTVSGNVMQESVCMSGMTYRQKRYIML
jgi:hypothetical protein